MSVKSVIAIVLAMCGSFTTILAVVGYVAEPVKAPSRRARTMAEAPPFSPPHGVTPQARQGLLTAPSPRAGVNETSTARPLLDVPTAGAPPPSLTDPLSGPKSDPGADSDHLTPDRINNMAQEATTRLASVESSLSQQLAALKKNRDAMLDQLSDRLRTLAPGAAATLVLSLDNEVGALALQRLAVNRRQAILQQLPDKRRTRIQRRLH